MGESRAHEEARPSQIEHESDAQTKGGGAAAAGAAIAMGAIAAGGTRQAGADPCSDTPPTWSDAQVIQRCVSLEEARVLISRLTDENRATCTVSYNVADPNNSIAMSIYIDA